MRPSSLSEIKKELETLDKKELVVLCSTMAKYKKENKELLTYLLFKSHDESDYVENVKEEIENQFKLINKTNIYFAKKSIRKALRIANKYIKYSNIKETEVQLLLYFSFLLKETGILFKNSTAMNNLYNRQLERINKSLKTLHEDLQYDYIKEMEKLSK
jgi:hypothetical protein